MTIIVDVASTATNILYNDQILNWVMPDVPMAPLGLVNNAIRDSVIDLCERALIWRMELPEILVTGAISTTTTAAQAVGDQQVTVVDTTGMNVGDTITVLLDDGTKWRGSIIGLPGGEVIQLDGVLNQIVDVGADVTKVKYLYQVTTPDNTSIAKGLGAWLNNSVIDPMSPDDRDTEFNNTEFGWAGVNWRTDVNLPTRWYLEGDTSNVVLFLAPNGAGGDATLRILVALKPSRSSTTFPTWIYERYIETIAHGAKWRLMMSPKKPYSDAKLGAWHGDMYNGMIGEARIRAARGTTRAALRSHTVFGLR